MPQTDTHSLRSSRKISKLEKLDPKQEERIVSSFLDDFTQKVKTESKIREKSLQMIGLGSTNILGRRKLQKDIDNIIHESNLKIIKLAKDIIKYIPRYIIVVKRINESTISSLHEKANPIADNARRNSFASSISDSINSIPESARLCLLLRVIESSVIRYEGYLEQLDPLNSVLHSNLLGKSKQQKEIDSNLEKEISCIVNDTTELALNLLPSFRRELAKFYATKINSLSSESSVTGNETSLEPQLLSPPVADYETSTNQLSRISSSSLPKELELQKESYPLLLQEESITEQERRNLEYNNLVKLADSLQGKLKVQSGQINHQNNQLQDQYQNLCKQHDVIIDLSRKLSIYENGGEDDESSRSEKQELLNEILGLKNIVDEKSILLENVSIDFETRLKEKDNEIIELKAVSSTLSIQAPDSKTILDLERANEKIKELKSKSESDTKVIAQLTEKLVSSTDQKKTLLSRIETQQMTIKDFEREFKKSDSKDLVSNENEELLLRISRLDQECNGLKLSLANNLELVHKRDAQVEEFTNKFKALQDSTVDKAETEIKLKELENGNRELTEMVENLSSKVFEAGKLIELRGYEIESLNDMSAENVKLITENTELKALVSDLKVKRINLELRVSELTTLVSNHLETIKSLEEKSRSDSNKLSILQQNIDDSLLHSRDENMIITSLNNELSRLKTEKCNFDLQLDEVRKSSSVEYFKAELQKKDLVAEDLTRELDIIKSNLDLLQNDAKITSLESTSLNTELKKKESVIIKLNIELDVVRSNLESKSNEAKSLSENSDSLKAVINQKELIINDLKKELDFGISNLESHLNEFKLLSNKANSLNSELQQKDLIINELKKELDTVRSKLDSHLNDAELLSKNADSLNSELHQKDLIIEELKKELDTVRSNLQSHLNEFKLLADLDLQQKDLIINELKKELDNVRSNLESHLNDAELFSKNADSLNSELQQKHVIIEELKKDLDTVKSNFNSHLSESKLLSDNSNTLNAQLKQKDFLINELKKELDVVKSNLESLSSDTKLLSNNSDIELQQKELIITDLRKELDTVKATLDSQSIEAKLLSNNANSFNAEVKKRDLIIEELQKDLDTVISNLDSQLTESKKSSLDSLTLELKQKDLVINDLNTELGNLRSNTHVFDTELDKLRRLLSLKNQELSKSNSSISQLESESVELKADVSKITSSVIEFEKERMFLNGKLDDLNLKVEILYLENEELRKKAGLVESLKSERDNANSMFEKLNKEQHAVSLENASQMDVLKNERDELKSRLNVLKIEADGLSSEKAELMKKLSSVPDSNHLEDLKKENDRLVKEAAALEEKMTELLGKNMELTMKMAGI